jgi:hypothetical protein
MKSTSTIFKLQKRIVERNAPLRRFFIRLFKNSFLLLYLYNAGCRIAHRKKFFREVRRRERLSPFDYLALAQPIPYYPAEPVVDSNLYGYAAAIKRYAGLGKLRHALEHGLYYGDNVLLSTFCRTTRRLITLSEHRRQVVQAKVSKPVVAVGPYIHYAAPLPSEEQVGQMKNTLGRTLLFFPSHSCLSGDQDYGPARTIAALKKLAEEKQLQAVVVSMYYYDILHADYAQRYENAGFRVATAGHRWDTNFLRRLKAIIALSDYTVSNAVGTHVGYCLYMGKPHYIFDPVKADDNYGKPDYMEIQDAFLQWRDAITPGQRAVAAKYWGFDDIKSEEELRVLLSKE